MFQTTHKHVFLFLIGSTLLGSCVESKEERQVALYKNYCASCHIAPDLVAFSNQLWESKGMPEMAASKGKWFLMDSCDNDNLGNEVIILSTLTYGFSPARQELNKKWKESRVDLVFLKNKLINN